MKCLSCGCEIPYDADKCPDCGESVKKQMQLTSATDTSAYSVKPALATPAKDIKLTYDALGSKKNYYLNTGPKIWCTVKLLIPLLAVLPLLIYAASGDLLRNYLPIAVLPAVLFLFRLVHMIRAGKCIREQNYETAWHYTRKTTLLTALEIFFVCFIIWIVCDQRTFIISFVLSVCLFIAVLFCMAHAGTTADMLRNVRLQEKEMLHAAETH